MAYVLTEIQNISKTKRRLHFDNGIVLPASSFETEKRGLYEGMELKDADYEALIHDITVKAEKYILGLLTDRDRTRSEITEKLKTAGYPAEIRDAALAYVDSYGYIDDERFARSFAEYYGKTCSRAVIKSRLLGKGVSAEIVEKVLAEAVPDEASQIREIIEKRYTDRGLDISDRKVREKAIRYLLSKGYSYSEIRDAI